MTTGVERDSRRLLSIVFGVLLVAAVFGLVGLAVSPVETRAPYTEFYVLGPEGKATNYPSNLSVGETGTVIVGIENHEHREVTYVFVAETDHATFRSDSVTLQRGEMWRDELSFTFESSGMRTVSLKLYRSSVTGDDPYRRLQLSVNVTGA